MNLADRLSIRRTARKWLPFVILDVMCDFILAKEKETLNGRAAAWTSS